MNSVLRRRAWASCLGGTAIAVITAKRLEPDVLPLVLLAAVAHPDAAVRRGLLSRLDDCIDDRRPLHTEADVRALLARQHGTPLEPFVLDPLAREIAVRVLRLVFSRRTTRTRWRWVHITSGEVFAAE